MKTNQYLKDSYLPHCDWRTFLKFTPSQGMPFIPEKDIAALDNYFQHFVVPSDFCIKCGAQQGSRNPMDQILGKARFRFGMKHGEGQCSTGGCGWPARAIHYDVGPLEKLEMILQYHPDVVTWDE